MRIEDGEISGAILAAMNAVGNDSSMML